MKYLILFFLLPLAGFSQEVPIAWNNASNWVVSNQLKDQLQQAFDSVNFVATVDTAWVWGDSIIQIGFSRGDTLFTDFIIGRLDHDTIYTQPAMYTCSNTCKNYNECYGGGCYKDMACKCKCDGDGGCTSINLAVYGNVHIGVVLRERILISNGHYIPER